MPFASLAQVPILKRAGFNVYGYPSFGFNYIPFNFKNTTGHFDSIIKQTYIRQALAHLQNEDAVVKGVFRTAAANSYGPVPAFPKNDFTPSNAATDPYPFSISAAKKFRISAAKKLLTDHGWHVKPGGTTTCKSPGTAANQCGVGIPAGTALSWSIYHTNRPATTAEQVTALVAAAKRIGITITASSKTFNYLIQNFSDVCAPTNANNWAMIDFGGFSVNNYPTTNQIFNTAGPYNFGGYSDSTADKLISNSVFGSDPHAASKQAAHITAALPAIFQPHPALVFAWSDKLSGPPDSFANLTQYRLSPEYWHFKK